MRIYSKFHDYYDSIMAYGGDPKTVYIRNTEEFPPKSKQAKEARSVVEKTFAYSPSADCCSGGLFISRVFYVVFCGAIIPCVVYNRNKVFPFETVSSFCYDVKSMIKFITKQGTKKDVEKFSERRQRLTYRSVSSLERTKDSPKEQMGRFYKFSGKKDDSVMEFQCKIGIPVFVYESGGAGCEDRTLVYNPMLKGYKFYKALDVNQTWQELSMFISGVMGGTAPPMVQISDVVRLEKHGFDKRISFRKEKHQRKGRR